MVSASSSGLKDFLRALDRSSCTYKVRDKSFEDQKKFVDFVGDLSALSTLLGDFPALVGNVGVGVMLQQHLYNGGWVVAANGGEREGERL